MSDAVKIVYYPSTGKVYTPAELSDVFRKFSVHDEAIAALRQIFQVRFARAAIDAANLNLSERAAGHAGGRIQEISEFREEILGYLAAADPVSGEPPPPARSGRRRRR